MFRLLNPILHAYDPQQVQRYQVEPYVIATDVYSLEPHIGRGGWTWYTGSAAWMYRLGVEIILGIKRSNHTLSIDPRIPSTWAGFEISYRYGTSHYQIRVCNPEKISHGVKRLVVDGEALVGNSVPLVDDGRIHSIQVEMGDSHTQRSNG